MEETAFECGTKKRLDLHKFLAIKSRIIRGSESFAANLLENQFRNLELW